jgi:hypothetical protein
MEKYPFSLYKPSERFAELAKSELAQDMWHCVTSEEAKCKLLSAIEDNKPAISNLDSELHNRFSSRITDTDEDHEELRILCMNMMKQFLEYLGYEHVGCALRSDGEFVKSAGIFQKK